MAAWVAHSTIPNVHPPGVEAYLVLWYKVFGYSIPVTRVAMLAGRGGGLAADISAGDRLEPGHGRRSRLLAAACFCCSPLFYMQSFMAQLDMPAMVFTLLALLFFIKRQYVWAAARASCWCSMKETGMVTPLVSS